MLILKIQERFLPTAVSKDGYLCDPMDPPYIGFRAEVIGERSWDGKPVPDSRLVGTQHIILERATGAAAAIHRDAVVSVANEALLQGLATLPREDWQKQTKVTVNQSETPILKILIEN